MSGERLFKVAVGGWQTLDVEGGDQGGERLVDAARRGGAHNVRGHDVDRGKSGKRGLRGLARTGGNDFLGRDRGLGLRCAAQGERKQRDGKKRAPAQSNIGHEIPLS